MKSHQQIYPIGHSSPVLKKANSKIKKDSLRGYDHRVSNSVVLSPIKKFAKDLDFQNDFSKDNQNEKLMQKIALMQQKAHNQSQFEQGLQTPINIKKKKLISQSINLEDSYNLFDKSTFSKKDKSSINPLLNSKLRQSQNKSQITTERQQLDTHNFIKPKQQTRFNLNFKRNSQGHIEKSAYHELLNKVANSHMSLRKVKNGTPIFPSSFLKENQNIPFLKEGVLKEDLRKYLQSGQIYIPNTSLQNQDDLCVMDEIELKQVQHHHSVQVPIQKKLTIMPGVKNQQTLNLRQLRARSTISHIFEREEQYQVKDQNKLMPIAITERKKDKSLEAKLNFPINPAFLLDENMTLKHKRKLMPFIQYCQQKNISFTDNEQRFYELKRNKQNFKYWLQNWKRYCNQNMMVPTTENQRRSTMIFNFQNLPIQDINQSPRQSPIKEDFQSLTASSFKKSLQFQSQSPNNSNKKGKASSLPFPKSPSPFKVLNPNDEQTNFMHELYKRMSVRGSLDTKKIQNLKIKKKLDRMLDLPVSITEKQVKNLDQANQQKKSIGKQQQNYYEVIENKRKGINDRLLKVLERVDLDRPILLKEKFDILWNFEEIFAEKNVIQEKIDKKKVERSKFNKQMAEKYNQLLDFINRRYQAMKNQRGAITESIKPLDSERKFMEFLRIIIEGGWIVTDPREWIEIIDFLDIEEELQKNHQCSEFMIEVSRLFSFEIELRQAFKLQEHKL
eukprot:403359026